MPLKLAIAGVGNVARDNYLPFLAAQDGVELGYWNRTPSAAADAAARFGGTTFGTLEKLAAWAPDTVFVLTSEMARRDTARALIGAGARRLFLEKPLVAARGQAHVGEADFEDGRALLRLAREKGCETAMVFNYRFFQQTLAARRIAAERNFGPVIHVAAQVHYACWSHVLDLVHHFAGELAEVSALEGGVVRQGQGIEAPDLAASLRFAGGGTGIVLGTAGMAWQHPLYDLTLTFQNGRLHLRDIDDTLEILDTAHDARETRSLVRDGSRWTAYGASFGRSLAAYLASVRAGEPPPIPGIDGLRELQAEAALRRSVAQRRPVRVADEFPLS